MGDPRHDLGLLAEAAVASWLSRAGWTILARRRRSSHGGEIDVLARDRDGALVAIEVRARRSERAGRPSTSIDGTRVARLRRTLASQAHAYQPRPTSLRVDLVTAEPQPGSAGVWRLRRIAGVDAW